MTQFRVRTCKTIICIRGHKEAEYQVLIGPNTKGGLVGASSDHCLERRDANPLHVKVWKETLDDARRKYLEPNGPVNGPLSYVHLQHLFTQPTYQYNGAATMLTKWGIDKAQEHGLAIGLFSSPMGELFLRELKFQRLAKVIVQAA